MSLQSSQNLAKTGAYGPLPVSVAPTELGTDEVQTITYAAGVTGGTHRLAFGAPITTNVAWSATNETLRARVQLALERLSSIGAGNIVVTVGTMTAGIGTLLATFTDQKGKQAVATITVNSDDLTGSGSVSVAETTPGVDCSLRGAAHGAIAVTVEPLESAAYVNTGTPEATVFALLTLIPSLSLGSPALGTTPAVHAAVTDAGSPVTVTTGITSPPTARNVTATAGGIPGDIKAIAVTVTGTDVDDGALVEVLPVFTVDTPGTVVGSKAFKTVTSIAIPAHDGTGATTAIGTGAKLGLDRTFTRDTVLAAFLAGVREATRPTVAFDAANVSGNTVTLATALAGTAVRVDFYR
jgi:hypothetical protein